LRTSRVILRNGPFVFPAFEFRDERQHWRLAHFYYGHNILSIILWGLPAMSDKKARTRERILGAATSALIRRGPLDPSVGEVMNAAGLTVGGFYTHFESKEALMLEAFRDLLGRRRKLLRQLDDSLSAEERRVLAAAFYLSRKHRDAGGDACPLPSTLGELSRLPEPFRAVLVEHIELMVADLAGSPEDADKVLADLALMVGGLALARALGNGELSDRILRAAKSAVL